MLDLHLNYSFQNLVSGLFSKMMCVGKIKFKQNIVQILEAD